uniref:Myocilin n=1 Tax=Hucho hucho TaxID=62062 RepID=A0A4W5PE30_9TELE
MSSRMWLPVALCLSFSLQRSNYHTGRCQYTFTVDNPAKASCPGASGGPEMEGVKSHTTGGPDQQDAGRRGSRGRGKSQLQEDKEQLNRQVQELQRRMDELIVEAETLRQTPYPDYAPYQEMKAEVTEVPASRLIQEAGQNHTGCGELVSVGESVLHRKADSITGKYGVWLQDPEPMPPPPPPQYGNKMGWRVDTVGKDVRQLFAYEDMEQFAKGFPMKVLVLPVPVESTGATLYGKSLYYQRRNSRTLLRYDLASESLAARLELPHAGFHGQHPDSWGGYTDIDLAVDEQVPWAIYSPSKAKGAIVASQLDP